MRKLVSDDGASVRDKSFDNILLKPHVKIKVGPCFVPVFQNRHAENEVVHILDVTLTTSLVTKAKHYTRNPNIREGHVIGSSRQHLREFI